MRRPVSIALTAAAVASLAAGCGSDSSSSGPSPKPEQPTAFSARGVNFTAPTGWTVRRGTGNLVATVAAGDATVAVWRYPRGQELPTTKDELKAARDGLVAALDRHDDQFEAIKTAPTQIGGQPAVQVRARETIAGTVRTVRSSHIYAGGAEYVVDAYAPDRSFRAVDAQVFRPLLRTLTVQGAAQTAP